MENAQYKQVFEVLFQLQNVWQKSRKNPLKILWANLIKLLNHLIAFRDLHRPYCFTLPSSVLVSLWSKLSKNIFFSGSPCVEILLWQKQLIPASFYLKSISLFIISATLLYLSTIPSCMFAVGEETSKPETSYSYNENFIATPHQVTQSQKTLFVPLYSVFLWSIETTTANL